LNEIIASRGALRSPLPALSSNSTPTNGASALPAASKPSLQKAEMPYPAAAVCLCSRNRSAR
jgi:hypothetical protein